MAIIKKNKQTNKKNKQHKLYTKKQKCLKGGSMPKVSLVEPPKGLGEPRRSSIGSSGYGSIKGSFSSLGSSSSSNTLPKTKQSSSMFGEVPNPNKFKKAVTTVMNRIKKTTKLVSPVVSQVMKYGSTKLTRAHNENIAKKQRQVEEAERVKAEEEAKNLEILIKRNRMRQPLPPVPVLGQFKLDAKSLEASTNTNEEQYNKVKNITETPTQKNRKSAAAAFYKRVSNRSSFLESIRRMGQVPEGIKSSLTQVPTGLATDNIRRQEEAEKARNKEKKNEQNRKQRIREEYQKDPNKLYVQLLPTQPKNKNVIV